MSRLFRTLGLGLLVLALPALVFASSHSEAPGTSRDRLIDDTDLYAFVSPDKPNTVTIVGNWVPLLEPNAGPNFYAFDDNASYYMNIDNVGDAQDHIQFQFKFKTHVRNGNTFLYNVGPVGTLHDANLNVYQTITVTRFDNGVPTVLGADLPVAPANVGRHSMPNYEALANQAISTLSDGTRLFVGPRDDPFFVDLGAIFDLLTIRRLPGNRGEGRDGVAGYNVMTIALQVPMTRLTKDGKAPGAGNSIIGLYDSAKRPQSRTLNADGTIATSGPEIQVSRLGAPLVNEVVIPLAMKDKFNGSEPADDGQFLNYVTSPELAGLFHALYNIDVPAAPRNDLVSVFLTGVAGLNQPAGGTPCEMLRLNMAIPPTRHPNRFGVIAGDLGGFPNGRRLADDVVDIAERVVAGVLVPGFDKAPNNQLGDGVDFNDRPYLPVFPYVAPPFSGFDSPHARETDRDRDGRRWDDDSAAGAIGDDGSVPASQLETEAQPATQGKPSLHFSGKNPASAQDLAYTLNDRARVSLRIYDLAGRAVRTLVDQDAAAGTFAAHWDGHSDNGASVQKGLYFARFTLDGRAVDTRKIALQ